DLRDRAPDIREYGLELIAAHRRIRLPRQHRFVEPAPAQKDAELACLLDVEAKLLLAGDRPTERALAVGDKAVHRNTHRVDQHGFKLVAPPRKYPARGGYAARSSAGATAESRRRGLPRCVTTIASPAAARSMY